MPAPSPEPTDRQADIYAFIEAEITGKSRPPTVREIARRFGIKSPNGVMCHLRALERKGKIVVQHGQARAIQLVRDPRPKPLTKARVEAAVLELFKSDEVGATYNRLVQMRIADESVAYGQSVTDVVAVLCEKLGVTE